MSSLTTKEHNHINVCVVVKWVFVCYISPLKRKMIGTAVQYELACSWKYSSTPTYSAALDESECLARTLAALHWRPSLQDLLNLRLRGSRVSLDVMMKKNSLSPLEVKHWFSSHLACSPVNVLNELPYSLDCPIRALKFLVGLKLALWHEGI